MIGAPLQLAMALPRNDLVLELATDAREVRVVAGDADEQVTIVLGVTVITSYSIHYTKLYELGGIIFYAAGRHPLAGIACAFAGVSAWKADTLPTELRPRRFPRL